MTLNSVTFYSVDKKIQMFEVTVAYHCECQQVFYGVRCSFDALVVHIWSSVILISFRPHIYNKRCLR